MDTTQTYLSFFNGKIIIIFKDDNEQIECE